MAKSETEGGLSLDDLFPESSRALLTGTGRQFIERVGVEIVRDVVLGVMCGENIRSQTEPITRQRIAQLNGALIAMYARGGSQDRNFSEAAVQLAAERLKLRPRSDGSHRNELWIAQWILGLTGKSVQNVLGGKSGRLEKYVTDLNRATVSAAENCYVDLGDVRMELRQADEPTTPHYALDWTDMIRLATAIGAQTLTIRGSDKSMFGKLFERLILGSLLTILGFRRVQPSNLTALDEAEGVFWLSDSSTGNREADATLILQPGKIARFDIGFIGPGNSEISKDKLSRYEREVEAVGRTHRSNTFIIVDRLPNTEKTRKAAERIGAEIVQMSMQYWPRELAAKLQNRFGFKHGILTVPDIQMRSYLVQELQLVKLQDFLDETAIQEPMFDENAEQ